VIFVGSRGRTENRFTLFLAALRAPPARRIEPEEVTRLRRGTALIFSTLVLAGCAGPMGQREAEQRASRSLTRFCQQTACGAARLLKAQKIKDRWLVDFETQAGLYTVAVGQGGNTDVTVWDKNPVR
jgi:hypothetical protein